MTPVLVTAPIAQPVDLATLKQHLRVSDAEDDGLITDYAAQAVAHLDGWTGVLGRCIMPQTWKVSGVEGQIILPMPDVTTATASYAAGPTVLDIVATSAGPCVTLTEKADVDFTCEMAATLLPAAQAAVKLFVSHLYDETDIHDAFHSVVSAIRWRTL